MAGIGVILNPYSRSNRRHPRRARRLGFIVGDKGSCHETRSVEDIDRLALEFRRREIEILGISGGDGTLHTTLTSFINAYQGTPLPKIAFLRGGTMNNTAGCLGIRGRPERILSDLILKYHHDELFQTTPLDLMNVNGKFGFIFGMGVVERFIEHYERVKVPTPTRAALLLSRYVLSAMANGKDACRLCRRFDATVTVGDEVLSFRNYTMLFAGTIETLGLGFRPMPRARHIPGQFELVGVSSTPRRFLANLVPAFLKRPLTSPNVLDRVGKSAVVELAEPLPYTIDGDTPEAPASRIEISMGPKITCIVS